MWPNLYVYRDKEDDDGSGNGGGDGGGDKDGDKDAAAAASEARFAALEKAVGLIAQGSEATSQGMAALVAKIEGMTSSQSKDEGGGRSRGEDVDLETMDRKEFAAHLMGQLGRTVEEALKPLSERFGQLDEKIDGQSLSTTIKEFTKDHPDFFEWKDEIRGLVKQNPTLTPARLYTLARAENSEKAKKLDEKYGLNKTGEVRNDDKVMSLFPRTGSSATKSGAGRMDPKQAAQAAWDEVMSKLG